MVPELGRSAHRAAQARAKAIVRRARQASVDWSASADSGGGAGPRCHVGQVPSGRRGWVRNLGLPCRPTLLRRFRRQGLRARGASACGLRPSANPDGCAAAWCPGLGQSRPTQTGVRHVAVFQFFGRCRRCAAGARCRWPSPSCACRGGAVAGAARAVAAGAARCHDVVRRRRSRTICAWRSVCLSTRCSACCSSMRSTASSR